VIISQLKTTLCQHKFSSEPVRRLHTITSINPTVSSEYSKPPLLTNLTGAQAKFVVDHPLDADAILVAGPGTGKTHCIASRVVYLTTQLNVSTDDILVIAPSEKAACELRRLIDMNLPIALGTVSVKSLAGLSAHILNVLTSPFVICLHCITPIL